MKLKQFLLDFAKKEFNYEENHIRADSSFSHHLSKEATILSFKKTRKVNYHCVYYIIKYSIELRIFTINVKYYICRNRSSVLCRLSLLTKGGETSVECKKNHFVTHKYLMDEVFSIDRSILLLHSTEVSPKNLPEGDPLNILILSSVIKEETLRILRNKKKSL